MNYKKAIEEIQLRRKNDLLFNEQRIISAMRENADLRALDVQIRGLERDERANGDSGAGKQTKKLETLKKQRSEMFAQMSIHENVPYTCPKCGDTGLIDGKICPCVISMSSISENPQHTFADSDLNVFAPSDRERAEKTYRALLAFCEKFPDTNTKNLILVGKTGTGKTFLASCVAARLEERGFSALFTSAFGFVNRMLRYHTAPVDEKLDYLLPLIDCDLLIIDDLGTESVLKNVTVEYLYNVLNERMRLARHTLITTNLDQEALAARYGERIVSRLCDKRLSVTVVPAEHDLRRR
ncbi:MAG: ATP-binding protein [Firmicutes bacterium]|nr:ATP-binding protein [Bacillota bacterium]